MCLDLCLRLFHRSSAAPSEPECDCSRRLRPAAAPFRFQDDGFSTQQDNEEASQLASFHPESNTGVNDKGEPKEKEREEVSISL